jgi:hypothetical protein
MYSLIALLAGAAAKIYDDLEDNNLLQKFYNNTFMEFLKGLHYISFITVSIEEPMFFIIQYVANLLNQFTNKEAWNKPYEHSLLYSALLLFIIIDYKKITSFCLIDKLLSIMFILGATVEPIAMKFLYVNKDSEYSSTKMNVRGIMVIIYIILYYLSKSNTLKYMMAYVTGYLVISVLVQFYSLREEKIRKEIEDEKEKEIKEIKEVKEKEMKEMKEVKEIEEQEVKKEIKEIKEIKEVEKK